MELEILSRLRDFCRDDAAFEQLQKVLIQEIQPLERAVEQAHFQVEQQKALFHVITRLREPLDLDTIFQATAREVRQLLSADRVGIFRFHPDSRWDDGEFVSEDVDPAFSSAIAQKVHDHCFGDQFAVDYAKGRVQAVTDIYEAGLSDCHIKILAQFQVRANLAVPLIENQKLWGLLCIHQCNGPRQWQAIEIEFVTQIANHLSVALQQAELFVELRSEISERQQAEQRATALNEGLRQAILELKSVNKELESFSYSVSHDLRAPLRSIDGFSQALLEDCSAQLNNTGQDYLHRIRTATQRMGQLIDDLLTLSRVTRSDMSPSEVDLSRIATRVCNDLQRTQSERLAEFMIQPGLLAQGDERLLQVVLENLLNNAWKFTAKHAQAKIEFGSILPKKDRAEKREEDCAEDREKDRVKDRAIPSHPIYFVRDDGAGFDMAYADKLFGPFQRLHGTHDFPGNGIGLATVQRIIHRHGGRVWAEGTVGQGAVFYFTLMEEKGEALLEL
jgi:light-regulated signal transduction histidine kinase (bacteriophytochrome)